MNPHIFTTEMGWTLDFDLDALCCIVQLPIDDSRPEKVRPIGTGFYIFCDRMVITAKHLFTHCDEDYGPIFVHNLAGNGSTGMARYLAIPEHVYGDPVTDIALVILQEGQSPPMNPFLPGPHDYEASQGLVAVGYTPSQSLVEPKHWDVRLQMNHVRPVQIEERERRNSPTEYCISYHAPFAECGHSGGPLLNADGRVVGVVVEQAAQAHSSDDNLPRTIARATSLKPIIELFKRHLPAELLSLEVRSLMFGERS